MEEKWTITAGGSSMRIYSPPEFPDDYLVDMLIDLEFTKQIDVDQVKAEEAAATLKVGILARLLEKGLVTRAHIVQAKAKHFGAEVVDLSKVEIPPDVIALVPAEIARKYQIIPVAVPAEEACSLVITLADPTDVGLIDSLQYMLKLQWPINIRIADPEDIKAALQKYYPS